MPQMCTRMTSLAGMIAVALVMMAAAGVNSQAENCPSGWSYYNRHCYLRKYAYRYTYVASRTYCLTYYAAHLASIRSPEERQHVQSYLATSSLSSGTSVFIGMRLDGNGIPTWDDGRSVTYTNWAEGEPRLGNSGGDCVYLRYTTGVDRDLWYVTSCGSLLGNFLCKRPSACGTSLAVYYYQNKCYTPVHSLLRQPQASSMCRLTYSSELLSLHTATEVTRLTDWAALELPGGAEQWVFIGLNSTNSQPFQWTDGSTVDYTNWLTSEPIDLAGDRCVEMYLQLSSPYRGRWRVADCASPGKRFVCVGEPAPTAMVPLDDDETPPNLQFNPQAPRSFQVKCYADRMVFHVPHGMADPARYSTPCLASRQADDALRRSWGNLHLAPGDASGPLLGGCRCAATNDATNRQWVFSSGYNECGTTVSEIENGKISFMNTIFSGELSQQEVDLRTLHNTTELVSEYGLGYLEPRPYLNIGLRCDFPAVMFSSSFGYVINVFTSLHFNITGVGSFHVTSRFIDATNDSPLHSDVRQPARFDIATPISFELELQTGLALSMRPLECWISLGDYRQHPRAYFIDEGCPKQTGVIVGSTSWRNGTSRYMRLSYNAFAFQGQEQATYYQHCTFRICSPQNTGPCTRHCSANARRRRAVDENSADGKFTISSQPFNFQPSAAGAQQLPTVVPREEGAGGSGASPMHTTISMFVLTLTALAVAVLIL